MDHHWATRLPALWAPVAAFVVGTTCYVKGDNAYYAGVPIGEIGALDGLGAGVIVVSGTLLGLVPLVIALVFTIRRHSPRLDAAILFAATWTAGWFVVGTLYLMTHSDVDASVSAMRTQDRWEIAGCLVGLVPLVVAGLVLVAGRRESRSVRSR